MTSIELSLPGAFVIELDPKEDERGLFLRTFCRNEFQRRGLRSQFVQNNASICRRAGTLRGLHYQLPPHEEVKLIQCVRGAIYDVLVDLRTRSPTYCGWQAVELTEDDPRAVYVPEGFAHGYMALRDNTRAEYLVSAFYEPGAQRGIRWNDPTFDIRWPMKPTVLSEADRTREEYVP